VKAKATYRIEGLMLVILSEDKTKVKTSIAWESQMDTLMGFYGPKENHMYISTYRTTVGSVEAGIEGFLVHLRVPRRVALHG
jgi:hypothetical protein